MSLPAMAASRQGLVTVAGISGYWSKIDAVSKTATATRQFDGGSMQAEILMSNPEVDDFTVSRPFRPGRDDAELPNLYNGVGSWSTTITIQYTDARLSPVGAPISIAAWLTKVETPAVDSGSGDAMMLVLTFSPTTIA